MLYSIFFSLSFFKSSSRYKRLDGNDDLLTLAHDFGGIFMLKPIQYDPNEVPKVLE